jgi:hypothetical protein
MRLCRVAFLLNLLLIGCLVLAAAGGATAQEPNCAGAWISSYLGSKLEATVEQHDTVIKGVAYVTGLGGDRDTYHFRGEIQGGVIKAAHQSGHNFEGRLLPTGEIEGTLITGKNGYRIDLVARRPSSAP